MKKTISLILALIAISTFASAQSSYTYSSGSNYNYGPYTSSYYYGQTSYDDDVVVNEVVVGTTTNDASKRDSFRAGRAFASAFWYKLYWTLYYRDVNGNSHTLMATSDWKGVMNSIKLDGKVIIAESDDTTIPGIPVPKGGMRNVTVHVSGVDRQEIPRVTAYENFDIVDANHPITIQLLSEYVAKHIKYDISKLDLPAGFDTNNLQLVLEDGSWAGYYDSWYKGFVVWTDPSLKPFYVTIMTNNGLRYGSFQIDPHKQEQKPFQGTSVNIQLAGNVHRFDLRDTGGHFSANTVSEINGNLEGKDGKNRKGKVFIVENKWRMPLDFSMYGLVNGSAAKMKISAYFVYPDYLEEAGEVILSASKYGNFYEIAGTLSVEPYADESASMMYVVEVLSGQPVGDFNFHLSQFHNGKQPVYDGEMEVSGFQDQGFDSRDENNTYGDFTFTFEVTAHGGDVRVFADEVLTYVETAAGGNGTVSRSGVMESTADEVSNAVFVVQEGETETFTVIMTVYNASETGFYRVGLDKVGSLDLNNASFRTDYQLINFNGGGKG